MSINDPGNAGTASEPPNGHTRPGPARYSLTDDDAGRTAMALSMAVVSTLSLLPAVVVTTLTGEWRWLVCGLACWPVLIFLASGIVIYRHGRRR